MFKTTSHAGDAGVYLLHESRSKKKAEHRLAQPLQGVFASGNANWSLVSEHVCHWLKMPLIVNVVLQDIFQ